MGVFYDSAAEKAQKEKERLEHEETIRLLEEAVARAQVAQEQAEERLRQLEQAETLRAEQAEERLRQLEQAETLRAEEAKTLQDAAERARRNYDEQERISLQERDENDKRRNRAQDARSRRLVGR
jgi:hypothetical protein